MARTVISLAGPLGTASSTDLQITNYDLLPCKGEGRFRLSTDRLRTADDYLTAYGI